MAFKQSRRASAYCSNQPLDGIFPSPIVANRAPSSLDQAEIGQIWIYSSNNFVYILTSISIGAFNWQLIESSGGAGVFSSLTVNPGPINLTGVLTQLGTANINASGTAATNIGAAGSTTTVLGTVNINATGAALTTIGTGGTGAVHIGNATGNTAVTGSLTASLAIQATGGAIVGLQVIANGDLGNGFANETSLTNASIAAGGTSAGMVVQTSAGAGVTASAGFLKGYLGVTPIYIPYSKSISLTSSSPSKSLT